jgi:serine protease inhibitor
MPNARQAAVQQRRRAIGTACAFLLASSVLVGYAGDPSAAPQTPSEPATTGSAFAQAAEVQQARKSGAAVSAELVAADNGLGIDLLNVLRPHESTNLSLSPTSIALALHMLYNGAAGTTREAMAHTLRLHDLRALQVDADNASLQASLVDPDPDVQLRIANSLWMHLGDHRVLRSFARINQTYYGAQIGDLAGAPADVNEWIAHATGGWITHMLAPDFNPDSTVLVIANALYFKGAWEAPFNPRRTTSMPFTRADGTRVRCRMMRQTGRFQYLRNANVQVIRLRYGRKNRMSMIVVLPHSGTPLQAVLGSLGSTQLDSWITQLKSQQVAVGLPRFTTRYNTSLVAALTTLGMGIAFSREANLSALASRTRVSSVQHATLVQVDEAGTVAAGVTTIGVVPTAVVQTVRTMIMDHPFLYAVRDDQTGALLFIGLMFDPTGT